MSDTRENVIVIRPKSESHVDPWIIRMDRISAYHPSIDPDTKDRFLELLVDGQLLRFNESNHEALLVDNDNHKWAVVPWDQAHIAILGQFADQRFYTEIAVRDALKEQNK